MFRVKNRDNRMTPLRAKCLVGEIKDHYVPIFV